MKDILKEIASNKKREVNALFSHSLRGVVSAAAREGVKKNYSMVESLRQRTGGIIAEFKRRSPSKGDIFPMAAIESVIPGYVAGGAGACSVLTDTRFFGGSPADLAVAYELAGEIPLLRKDFIVDEVQIEEARVLGASTVLLIASILERDELEGFNSLAHELGMETLVEIHDRWELEKLRFTPDLLGVNNRNLDTFHTDVNHSLDLVGSLPKDSLLVAESGIRDAEDIMRLKDAGFEAFLVGEALMSDPDPGEALARMIEKLK